MRSLFLASLACVTACVAPVGSGPGAATGVGRADCAAATFPDDPGISVAFTDKFNGRCWNNNEQVTVWREGQRLFIGTPTGPRVQLQRAGQMQGVGAFRDGCGTTYDFFLPPDGPGGYVAITEPNGARSEWHRRV